MTLRTTALAGTLLALTFSLGFAARQQTKEEDDAGPLKLGELTSKGIRKGPLEISAEETTSKSHGKIIDASGNVTMRYEMESGDFLESFSKFAHYDDNLKTGEVFGDPRAVWRSRDPKQPETALVAKKIVVTLEDESLSAYDDVLVTRSSSTLSAQEMHYSNPKKMMTATGGRPVFEVYQPQHHTRITSEEVVAWTDRRQVDFNHSVRGVVDLLEDPKGLK